MVGGVSISISLSLHVVIIKVACSVWLKFLKQKYPINICKNLPE